MLHRLEIENFYSIKDLQVIDLQAPGNAPEDPERLAPAWKGSSVRVPKVVALFGPNASGKSNVLRALSFIAWFVRDSFGMVPGNTLPFQRFADGLEGPTRLAILLSGIEDIGRLEDPQAEQCRYAYEVVIGGSPQSVLKEALHYWPADASRRVRLFERDATGAVKAAKVFGLTGFRQALEKVLRPNVSVIATLTQLKHPFAQAVWNSAAKVVTNILLEKHEGAEDQVVKLYAENPALVDVFNREVERVDFGIQGLQLRQGRDGPLAEFRHEGLAYPMPLVFESHGTRQFMRLYPALLHALENGGVAILDELDAAIHPIILKEILRWFHDRQRNPLDAQLWMSCHSASLLEDLAKEEILFCDKDARGRTKVYGLSDIQAVRRTDNYYRKYLSGVYGAVPEIG